MLSFAIGWPLACALLLPGLRGRPGLAKGLAVFAVAVEAAAVGACCLLWGGASEGPWGYRFVEQGVVGLDGVSLAFVALAAVVGLGSIVAAPADPFRLAALLAAVGIAVGTFASLHVVLFSAFWAAALLPALVATAVRPGRGRGREILGFLVLDLAGSVLVVLALAALAAEHFRTAGSNAFDLRVLQMTGDVAGWGAVAGPVRVLLLSGFALRFALAPAFREQGGLCGLPAEHGGFWAAVVVKTGAYAVFRLALPLVPEDGHAFRSAALGVVVVGAAAAAWASLGERDRDRRLGWVATSQVALALAGIFAAEPRAVAGAVFKLVGGGLAFAGAWSLAGSDRDPRSGWGRLASLALIGVPFLPGGTFFGDLYLFRGLHAGVGGIVLALALGAWILGALSLWTLPAPTATAAPSRSGRAAAGLLWAFSLALCAFPRPLLELLDDPSRRYVHQVERRWVWPGGSVRGPGSGRMPFEVASAGSAASEGHHEAESGAAARRHGSGNLVVRMGRPRIGRGPRARADLGRSLPLLAESAAGLRAGPRLRLGRREPRVLRVPRGEQLPRLP